jgi:hypothetical protein
MLAEGEWQPSLLFTRIVSYSGKTPQWPAGTMSEGPNRAVLTGLMSGVLEPLTNHTT